MKIVKKAETILKIVLLSNYLTICKTWEIFILEDPKLGN